MPSLLNHERISALLKEREQISLQHGFVTEALSYAAILEFINEQNELLKKEQQAHLITKGKLIVREVELDRAIGTTPSQDNQCSTHHNAPHGFDRTASHNLGRYVCICEGWEPCA